MSDDKKPEASPAPMITLSLAEWDAMRSQCHAAEEALAALQRSCTEATFEAGAATGLASATSLARSALTIVRFAVGNLPPAGIVGWPTKAIFKICDLLPTLADKQLDDVDLAIELRAFARECEAHARRRAALTIDDR